MLNDSEERRLSASDESDSQVLAANAAWLVLLRWVAVVGQMLTIGVARFGLQMSLPVGRLVLVIGFTAVSNACFAAWTHHLQYADPSTVGKTRGRGILALVMVTDIVALTALLCFAGGTANPFSVFYLVNLALGAVLLSERWGWGLTACATLGMLVLLVAGADRPDLFQVDGWLQSPDWQKLTLGQLGRIVALAACALVIIHFVSRVTRQLEQTAAELRRVERERSRSEKLEALGTLAGGAAHELATPLSTIAVVAKELIRTLHEVEIPDGVREDVSLIRAEVDHCQMILQRMTGRAGRWMAEEHVTMNLQELVATTLGELAQAERVQVSLPARAEDVVLRIPRESLAQALRGLLQNALDATQSQEPVSLTVSWNDQQVQIVVQDEGPGMVPEVLARAGEPFFTTKDPGRGMGLGLFLTRSVIERLGGRLHLESELGRGVTAAVTLPRKGRTAEIALR